MIKEFLLISINWQILTRKWFDWPINLEVWWVALDWMCKGRNEDVPFKGVDVLSCCTFLVKVKMHTVKLMQFYFFLTVYN
jgi:hypothetical protein